MSNIDYKATRTVSMIAKDYRALLADGDTFKTLPAARDDIRKLLDQVDNRFEKARCIPSPSGEDSPLHQMAAMNIDEGPSVAPSQETSTPQSGSEVPATTGNEASPGVVTIKKEENTNGVSGAPAGAPTADSDVAMNNCEDAQFSNSTPTLGSILGQLVGQAPCSSYSAYLDSSGVSLSKVYPSSLAYQLLSPLSVTKAYGWVAVVAQWVGGIPSVDPTSAVDISCLEVSWVMTPLRSWEGYYLLD